MKEEYKKYLLDAIQAKKENELWLRSIRNIKPETLYDTIKQVHKEVF